MDRSDDFFLQVLNPGSFNLNNETALSFIKPTYILSVKNMDTFQKFINSLVARVMLSTTDPLIASIPVFTAVLAFITSYLFSIGYTDFLFNSKHTVIDVNNYLLLVNNNVHIQGKFKKNMILIYYYVNTMVKFFVSSIFSNQLILILLGCYWVSATTYFSICSFLCINVYFKKQFKDDFMSILDSEMQLQRNVYYIIAYLAVSIFNFLTSCILTKECLDMMLTYKFKNKDKHLIIFNRKIKISIFLTAIFCTLVLIPLFITKVLHLFLKNSTLHFVEKLIGVTKKFRHFKFNDYVYNLDDIVKMYEAVFNHTDFQKKLKPSNTLLKISLLFDFIALFIISFLIFIPSVYISYKNLMKVRTLFLESLQKLSAANNKRSIGKKSYWNDKYKVFDWMYSGTIFVFTFIVLVFQLLGGFSFEKLTNIKFTDAPEYLILNPMNNKVHDPTLDGATWFRLIQISWMSYILEFLKFLVIKTFISSINDFKKQTNVFGMWYSQVSLEKDILTNTEIKEGDTDSTEYKNVIKSKLKFLIKGGTPQSSIPEKTSLKKAVSFSPDTQEKEVLVKSLFNNDMTTMSIFSFTTHKKPKEKDVTYIKYPNLVKMLYESTGFDLKEQNEDNSETMTLETIHHDMKED